MNITITKIPIPARCPRPTSSASAPCSPIICFLMDYSADKGWHDARVVPYGPITMSPGRERPCTTAPRSSRA